jgi:hypothetical protein
MVQVSVLKLESRSSQRPQHRPYPELAHPGKVAEVAKSTRLTRTVRAGQTVKHRTSPLRGQPTLGEIAP